MDEFISKLKENNDTFNNEDNVYDSIMDSYKRVIVETLIATFGLDYIKDRQGGDVDTINNVRNSQEYKSNRNQKNWEQRGDYNSKEYHSDKRFTSITTNAKTEFNLSGKKVKDQYVEGKELIPRRNKTIEKNNRAELDHIIPAEKIHNDPGRVLAGIKGVDLANDKDNLAFTNNPLNRNKSNMSVEEYIAWCDENPDKVNYNGNKGEPLPQEVKEKMWQEYQNEEAKYNEKIYKEYYLSKDFWSDTAMAAGKVGVQMGIRQVMGFIFAEVLFVTIEELENVPAGCSLKEILETIGRGVKKGFESAILKYDKLIERFGEGLTSGVLASLTTTMCNIFFTTSKDLVNYIRQIYASVVRATTVLIINPDDLLIGERLKTSSIILATGASVLAGSYVGTKIIEIGIGGLPVVGNLIVRFCSSLVSGLISCSFLLFMDRSDFINGLVDKLNALPSEVTGMGEIIEHLEVYASELEKIDINKFKEDTLQFEKTAKLLMATKNEQELNEALKKAYIHFEIPYPWEGDFDEFMSNKNNMLVFE